jgi:hypothetical protein
MRRLSGSNTVRSSPFALRFYGFFQRCWCKPFNKLRANGLAVVVNEVNINKCGSLKPQSLDARQDSLKPLAQRQQQPLRGAGCSVDTAPSASGTGV